MSEGLAVPPEYWEDDCPCAKAGEYQEGCMRRDCLEMAELSIDQARESIGAKVVYRAPHVRSYEAGEEGVITSVNESYVFVRCGADVGSRATLAEQLTLVAA